MPSQAINIVTIEEVPNFLGLLPPPESPDLQAEPNFFYFHHPAWVEVVWQRWEAPKGSRPRLLLAYVGEKLAGWWPLVLSRRSVGYRLQNLGQELADYAIPFIYRRWEEQRAEITRQFLIAALARKQDYFLAQLTGFLYPPDPFAADSQPDLSAWLSSFAVGAFRVSGPGKNLFIDFRAHPQESQQFPGRQLSKDYLNHLKRYKKKLERLGPLQLIDLANDHELEAWREDYFAWYRYGRKDTAVRKARLQTWWEFYRRIPAAMFLGSALTVADQPLSLIIGFRRADQYDYFSPVFNPDYQAWGPDKIHLYLWIPELLRRGLTRFNFLTGEERYKQHWAQECYYSWKVKFYHRGNLPAFFYWLKEYCLGRF